MNATIINVYYWRPNAQILAEVGYDAKIDIPYEESKVSSMIMEIINKGYNVQTRITENGNRLIICVDKGNFKQM